VASGQLPAASETTTLNKVCGAEFSAAAREEVGLQKSLVGRSLLTSSRQTQ